MTISLVQNPTSSRSVAGRLLGWQSHVERAVQHELEQSRQEARDRSHEEAMLLLLLLLGKRPVVTKPQRANLDAARATVAARAYAASWSARVLVASRRIESAGDLPPSALLDATGGADAALERTIITESVEAWNDERVEMTRSLDEYSDVLEQEWVAILDRNACAMCAAMDGKREPLGESFEVGAPPVHPRCRCFIEFVPRALRAAA